MGNITRHRQGKIWLSSVLLFGLGCLANTPPGAPKDVQSSSPVTGGSCQVPSQVVAWEEQIVQLVNLERTARGLAPLRVNPLLTWIAEQYACEMIERDFFAHVNPYTGEGPGDRAAKVGYVYAMLGENLAAGQQTPQEAMADWMESTEGHRENILHSAWEEIGVGVRLGGSYGIYWVQEFGKPI